MYITKNYNDKGGDRTVVGGELHLEDGSILSKGSNSVGAFLSHLQVSAINATVADIAGVLLAVTDTGVEQVITADIIGLSVPKNITATAGGTAADVGAIQVIVEGTNYDDEVITETLPAFTVDTTGSVAGSKAFKTVTQITIPAHDGVLATTSIGFGEVLGLPTKLAHNTVLKSYFDNIEESTPPTVVVSSTTLEDNTIDLNSVLDSKVIDIYFIN
jgi:hypothetical protein